MKTKTVLKKKNQKKKRVRNKSRLKAIKRKIIKVNKHLLRNKLKLKGNEL